MKKNATFHHHKSVITPLAEAMLCDDLANIAIEHTASWSDVIIDRHKIHFTPCQRKTLSIFIANYGEPLSIETLHSHLELPIHERHNIVRYIRQVRLKLASYGFYILDMHDSGKYIFIHHS